MDLISTKAVQSGAVMELILTKTVHSGAAMDLILTKTLHGGTAMDQILTLLITSCLPTKSTCSRHSGYSRQRYVGGPINHE